MSKKHLDSGTYFIYCVDSPKNTGSQFASRPFIIFTVCSDHDDLTPFAT